MDVRLIDSMGTDLSVVNAARVSFDKKSSWERQIDTQGIYELSDGDVGLINFLARHNHFTPFTHTSITFHLSVPIFVARQLVKHQVGLSMNEVSRRYVSDEPEIYHPDVWRGNPENKKQGSDPNTSIEWLDRNTRVGSAVQKVNELALETYRKMITAGVCAEQARMVLPLSTYTQFYWTGSLYAWARVCNLRCAGDAQQETREIGWMIHDHANEKFPVSFPALFYSGLSKKTP